MRLQFISSFHHYSRLLISMFNSDFNWNIQNLVLRSCYLLICCDWFSMRPIRKPAPGCAEKTIMLTVSITSGEIHSLHMCMPRSCFHGIG